MEATDHALAGVTASYPGKGDTGWWGLHMFDSRAVVQDRIADLSAGMLGHRSLIDGRGAGDE